MAKEMAETKQEVNVEELLAKMAEMAEAQAELQAELQSVKKQETSAELTEGQKKALLELRLRETMEEAKKDTVKIELPIDMKSEDQDVFVSVNGERYLIQRGVEVEVPRFVAEALNDSNKQKLEALKTMNKLESRD